jgi:hypothetical protein
VRLAQRRRVGERQQRGDPGDEDERAEAAEGVAELGGEAEEVVLVEVVEFRRREGGRGETRGRERERVR